jgi:hypothetical protein
MGYFNYVQISEQVVFIIEKRYLFSISDVISE